jgi:hypothetical protein
VTPFSPFPEDEPTSALLMSPQQQQPNLPEPEMPSALLPPQPDFSRRNALIDEYQRTAAWQPPMGFLPNADRQKNAKLQQLGTMIQQEDLRAKSEYQAKVEEWKARRSWEQPQYQFAHPMIRNGQTEVPVLERGQLRTQPLPGVPPAVADAQARIEATKLQREAERTEWERRHKMGLTEDVQAEERRRQTHRLNRDYDVANPTRSEGLTPEQKDADAEGDRLLRQLDDAESDLQNYQQLAQKHPDETRRKEAAAMLPIQTQKVLSLRQRVQNARAKRSAGAQPKPQPKSAEKPTRKLGDPLGLR